MAWSVVICPDGVGVWLRGETTAAHRSVPCGYDKAPGRAAGVCRAPPAALLSRGRTGQEGDRRQPLASARRGDRADPRRVARRAFPRRRRGAAGAALAAGGPRAGGACDGAPPRATAVARPLPLAPASAGARADLPARARAGVEASDLKAAFRIDARRRAR